MTPTGSSDNDAKRIKRLNRSFNTEVVIHDDISDSLDGQRLQKLLAGRQGELRDLHASGDIRAIIRFEIAYLNAELSKFASDKDHKSSLEAGIAQLTVLDSMIDRVRDHKAYQLYDRQYVQLDKNRESGLPVDEARECFKSHVTRLGNTSRTRMTDGERSILEERRMNFNRALELYKVLQREALGLVKSAGKEQEMGRGLKP